MRRPTLTTLILPLALFAGVTLLPGCTGDHSPTVENDGRVTAPALLPR